VKPLVGRPHGRKLDGRNYRALLPFPLCLLASAMGMTVFLFHSLPLNAAFYRSKSHKSTDHGIRPLKLESKINLLLFKVD
jgi:hypothetical protein